MGDKIFGLYVADLSVRDIRAHFEDIYGPQVCFTQLLELQDRALELMYPIVIFDASRVKFRNADSRMVKNNAV